MSHLYGIWKSVLTFFIGFTTSANENDDDDNQRGDNTCHDHSHDYANVPRNVKKCLITIVTIIWLSLFISACNNGSQ